MLLVMMMMAVVYIGTGCGEEPAWMQRSMYFPVIKDGEKGGRYASLMIDKGSSTQPYILNVSQTSQCAESTYCISRGFPAVLTGERLLGGQNKCINVALQGIYYLNGHMDGVTGCSAVAVLHGVECPRSPDRFGEHCQEADAFPRWKDGTLVAAGASAFWAIRVPSGGRFGSLAVTLDTVNATGFLSCAYNGFPSEFTEDKGVPIDPVTSLGYEAARAGLYFFRIDNMGSGPLTISSAQFSLQNCSSTSYGPNCAHQFNEVVPGPEWTTIQMENNTACADDWCYFSIVSDKRLTATLLSGSFFFKTLNAPTHEDFDIALFDFNAHGHLPLLESTLDKQVILGAPMGTPFSLNLTAAPPGGLNGNEIVGILIASVTAASLLFVLVCNVTLKIVKSKREYVEI